MTKTLTEALMIELAYCHHVGLSISDTAQKIAELVTRKHLYWGAGESGCPREIKAGNGELHTLRCKVCGQDNPRNGMCFPDAGAEHD